MYFFQSLILSVPTVCKYFYVDWSIESFLVKTQFNWIELCKFSKMKWIECKKTEYKYEFLIFENFHIIESFIFVSLFVFRHENMLRFMTTCSNLHSTIKSFWHFSCVTNFILTNVCPPGSSPTLLFGKSTNPKNQQMSFFILINSLSILWLFIS